jgi:hypothetical protein
MSDRAGEFLVLWLTQHVQPLPPVHRVAEAVRLATDCRKDAVAAGVDLQEIRDAAGGDLIRKILEALNMPALVADAAPLAPDMEASVETVSS